MQLNSSVARERPKLTSEWITTLDLLLAETQVEEASPTSNLNAGHIPETHTYTHVI